MHRFILSIILVVYVILGALYAENTPKWQAPDEPAHFNYIRAIGETADGRLFQTVRFIKASGGCSAPPGGDLAAARAAMGRMALRVDGDLRGSADYRRRMVDVHVRRARELLDG